MVSISRSRHYSTPEKLSELFKRFFLSTSDVIDSPGRDVLLRCGFNSNSALEAFTQLGNVMTENNEVSFLDKARRIVFDYVKNRLEKTDTHVTFAADEVYVVWFSKTLQNWKAMVSTTLPDGMYYEVTYNGDKRETYLDAYKKFDNVVIPDEE